MGCPPICGTSCCDRRPCCVSCIDAGGWTCCDGYDENGICTDPKDCCVGPGGSEICSLQNMYCKSNGSCSYTCELYWYCDNGTCNNSVSPNGPFLTQQACEDSGCEVPPTYYVCSGVPGSNSCNVSPTPTPYTDKNACEAVCWTNWLYSCSGSPLYICSPGTTGTSQADCEINRLPGGSCTAPIKKYTCSGSTGTGGNPPYTCYETTPIGNVFSVCSSSCIAPRWNCSGAPAYSCTSGTTGTYSSEPDCRTACKALPTKWSCINNLCTESAPGGAGTWNTQNDCITSNTCGTYKCVSDSCRFSSNDNTGYTLESSCRTNCDKIWCCKAVCGCTSGCGTTTCENLTASNCGAGVTTYSTQSACTTNQPCCNGSHYECRFKAGATTDAPGNKECIRVNGARDATNPNHFSTESACKNDCGNSYNCNNCTCSSSKGLNGSEIFSMCDASCPDKTYRCDNGRCIQDICPSAGNPGLTYAACKLQCGKYVCPGSGNGFTVTAWGDNSDGKALGTDINGVPISIPLYATAITPVLINNNPITNISALSGGRNTVYALTDTGNILQWGKNCQNLCVSKSVDLAQGVSAIAAGGEFALALKGGKVYFWGQNTNSVGNLPTSVSTGVSSIAAGQYQPMALKNGGVILWGSMATAKPSAGILTAISSGVSAIACGYYHSCALKGGEVICWGSGEVSTDGSSPTGGGGIPQYGQSIVPLIAKSNVTAIACGDHHTAALIDGKVYVWGWNAYGQCTGSKCKTTTSCPGGSIYYNGSSPVQINGSILTGVIAISATQFNVIALKNDGSLVIWGWDGGMATIPISIQSSTISSLLGNTMTNTIFVKVPLTTATKCEFYGDTSSGFDTNALCEANTTCHTIPKYECVYTTCPNGRVLGSTCSPTTTFVAGVTYYDTFTQCEASACADIVDQGNRWKCVNNDCVFINYCDGDGTYKEVSGPNGCHENCWGWNCKNNHCTNELGATNNHDNCAASCHCQWFATILRNSSGEYCPACQKFCGKQLASQRSGGSQHCSDQWGTYCPESDGYFNTESKCKEYLTQVGAGEYACKENGTCEAIDPNFPVETPCGKYCSKDACEKACKPAVLGYVCVEPPVPYSGRTTCKQLNNCSASTAQFDTMEECMESCDYIVSRGWNCKTSDSGKSTCVALKSIEEGIPEFKSSELCNRFCINNFGWNCKGNQCIRAWEAPGSFSSYVQCANTCIIPDQGPCGNVVDTTTGSINNGGSTAQ